MTTTAQGVIAHAPGQALTVEEFIIDDPGPHEILVRITASGVCHTDLKVKEGGYDPNGFPFLLGHEGAGVVEAVGPGVTHLQPGDHVILAWRAPCGTCRFCRVGRLQQCVAPLVAHAGMRTLAGETLTPVLGIGTFCTHTLVHANQAIPYDPALPAAQMALIGCGVMTGVGAAIYAAQVQPGTSAAVFGCGGVGDSVIAGAKLAGATTIIAVDLDARKLEWARAFGATHTVNAREGDPVRQIKQITGGTGVQYAFDAVGHSVTLEQALRCCDLAGTSVLIGVPDSSAQVTLNLRSFFDRCARLRVSWYGDCLPTRDFPLLAAWYQQGQLDLDRMITGTIPLDQVDAAFAAMQRSESLRTVITFT